MNRSDPFAPPPNAFQLSTPEGEILVWRPAPNVVVQLARGELSFTIAQGIQTFVGPIVSSASNLQIFDHFEDLHSYTREAREHLTAFGREHRAAVDAYHVFTTSPFVALGITAYGLQVGSRVHSYANRASYERALVRAIAER